MGAAGALSKQSVSGRSSSPAHRQDEHEQAGDANQAPRELQYDV